MRTQKLPRNRRSMASSCLLVVASLTVVGIWGCSSEKSSLGPTGAEQESAEVSLVSIAAGKSTIFSTEQELSDAISISQSEFDSCGTCRDGLDLTNDSLDGRINMLWLYLLKKYGTISLRDRIVVSPELLEQAGRAGSGLPKTALAGYLTEIKASTYKRYGDYKITAAIFKNDYVAYWDVGADTKAEKRTDFLWTVYYKNVETDISVRAYYVDNQSDLSVVVLSQSGHEFDDYLSVRSWAVGAGVKVTMGPELFDPNAWWIHFKPEYLDNPWTWDKVITSHAPISLFEFKNKSSMIPAGVFSYHAARIAGNECRMTLKYNVKPDIYMPEGYDKGTYRIDW